jgi:hypothetical protein
MELKYWSRGETTLENVHIVKVPYGEIANMLCGIRAIAANGVFTEDLSPPKEICKTCARRLKAQRKRETARQFEDMRKLRRWQPNHPYLQGDRP